MGSPRVRFRNHHLQPRRQEERRRRSPRNCLLVRSGGPQRWPPLHPKRLYVLFILAHQINFFFRLFARYSVVGDFPPTASFRRPRPSQRRVGGRQLGSSSHHGLQCPHSNCGSYWRLLEPRSSKTSLSSRYQNKKNGGGVENRNAKKKNLLIAQIDVVHVMRDLAMSKPMYNYHNETNTATAPTGSVVFVSTDLAEAGQLWEAAPKEMQLVMSMFLFYSRNQFLILLQSKSTPQ